VPVTVTLEFEWVLRASFDYAKDEVMQVLSSLFSAAELTFESERALEVALQLYRKGPADFADCLHVALAAQAGELPLWTFDKRAAKVNGAQLIGRASRNRPRQPMDTEAAFVCSNVANEFHSL
jgi:predicted nucleic-acid-binding protein